MNFLKTILILFLFTLTNLSEARWPDKPVTVVVPYSPCGASDIIARKTAIILEKQFPGSTFVIKNMPGASNTIAINYVLNEKDSDNIFIVSNDDVITGPMSLGQESYNEFRVTNIIGHAPFMLAVSSRYSLDDFRDAMKNKKDLLVGTTGVNGGQALWVKSLTGPIGNWTMVPYKGAPEIITGIMGKSLDYVVLSSFNMYDYIQDGRVVPVTISSSARLKQFPNVPTFKELGFNGHEDGIYFAVYAKKTMDPEVLSIVNQAIQDAQKSGQFKDLEEKTLVITPLDVLQSNRYYQNVIKQKKLFNK